MANPTRPVISVAPVRVVGMRLTAFLAVMCLIFVLASITSLARVVVPSPWFIRIGMVILIGGYAAYMYYLSHPRLPEVTEEDTDPLSQRVYNSVKRVCTRVGVPMPRIVIDPAEQVNAVTFGFTPESAYTLFYEGLLQQIEDDRELDAVVAHEVSHIINRDCAIATVLNLVTLMAQLMALLGRAVLSLGAGCGGCMVQLASVFASGGLIGLFIGLGIICMFLVAMTYAAFFAALGFALLFMALLAVNAFQRQRERLADEFAAAVVGRTLAARVLVKVASSDPQDRMMLGQFIGLDVGGEGPVPAKDVLDGVKAAKPRFAIGARLAELLSDHPLGLRRIYDVLVGSEKPGFFNSLVGWLAGTIENRASWLTVDVAAQGRSAWDREAPTIMLAAILGFAAAILVAVSPTGGNVVIPLAVGLSLGLVLGAGTAWILVRRGPFLGTDVVDAVVTGTTVWLISEEVFSTILVLPSDPTYLLAVAVVFITNPLVTALGYVSLSPTGLYAEEPATLRSEGLPSAAPPRPPRGHQRETAARRMPPLPAGLAARAPAGDQQEEDMVILEPADPAAHPEGQINDDASLFDRDYDD